MWFGCAFQEQVKLGEPTALCVLASGEATVINGSWSQKSAKPAVRAGAREGPTPFGYLSEGLLWLQ